MPEQFARGVNGIDLCYETFGDPADPPLLLIMGVSAQMVLWDDEFCALLAGRGFHVVRYDSRDCGRSTYLTGRVSLRAAYVRRRTPYMLEDMADDAAALIERLGLGRVHVVGASMGGMVAQSLAIRYPELVTSLTSMMSTTGRRWVGRPAPRGAAALMATPPTDREGYIEHHLHTFRQIGSPGFAFDERRMRVRAGRAFDRGINRPGTARHLGAVLASYDRTRQLRRLQLPAAIIHGAADQVIDVSGGLATVRAIPRSELHVFNGMGHDLPAELWPRFADIIERISVPARRDSRRGR
jgi:pimeloyl-ACP methyl ester carboxylesterase